MASETLEREPSRGAASSLPRAVWIGGGVLCLTVAALAGALVTKSVDAPRQVAASNLPINTPSDNAMGANGLARQDEVAPPRSASPVTEPVPAAVGRPVPLTQGSGYAAAPAATPAPAPAATPARTPVARPAPAVSRPAVAPCTNCGTVESVQAVRVKAPGSGLGAVAGGVLGGVVGNQFGHGNGKAAMTVLGAVGGGFAGNEVERRTRAEETFDVSVRMRDGSYRVIRETQPPAVGAHVVVEGSRLRAANG